MENRNNKDNQKGKLSLPPLLPGSEYKTANSNICRTANLLGQAIAIVVYAGDGKRSKSDKEALLKLFEQECKKVINRSTVSWHFSQIQSWLKASLSGKPDWHELYKLADHQLILCKKDHTKWWDDVKSICGDPDAGTNAYDPVPDILRASQEYGKKEPGKKEDEMPPHYVPCTDIMVIVRTRSDAIARKLMTAQYPVFKKAGKNYCDPKHAAVLFPKWKKHWKMQHEE